MFATALADERPDVASWSPATKGRQPSRQVFAADRLPCAIRTIEAKEHIFREGDGATHLYLVEVGHVCIYHMLSDGRRQVVDFAYPGDYIGLGAMGEHATSAQATTRTSVRCIPLASLHDLIRRDARVGAKLCQALSLELLAARELLFTISQRTAPERLARFLLALSRRNERRGMAPNEIVLPMTRTDIADLLGLTIETVSRTFSKFRADGLIDLEQCILVTIMDPEGLACAAGEGQNTNE
jgi:CRP/FNR family transcriptional regulator